MACLGREQVCDKKCVGEKPLANPQEASGEDGGLGQFQKGKQMHSLVEGLVVERVDEGHISSEQPYRVQVAQEPCHCAGNACHGLQDDDSCQPLLGGHSAWALCDLDPVLFVSGLDVACAEVERVAETLHEAVRDGVPDALDGSVFVLDGVHLASVIARVLEDRRRQERPVFLLCPGREPDKAGVVCRRQLCCRQTVFLVELCGRRGRLCGGDVSCQDAVDAALERQLGESGGVDACVEVQSC